MDLLKGKKIIFISAHLDDLEFGCGATISRYSNKCEIYLVELTLNRRDSNGNIQETRDKEEAYRAAEVLNISQKRVLFPEVEISGQLFPECRQKILETLYHYGKLLNPDVLFVPSLHDIHQDHVITAESALKAFKRKTVIGYEIVNSSHGFLPNLFISVGLSDIKNKCKAIQSYKSQINCGITTGDYFSEEIITGLGRARGVRSGNLYAEAFEIYTMNIPQEGN